MKEDAASLNYFWATLAVEELRRCGVLEFCLAPGSRCTPLTVAAARCPDVGATVHYDERGLGFMALGQARASGRPSAVVCTSGTALANLAPAVVEAAMDGVPMLLLTADRPPELRQIGANQSIDQVGLFGRHCRWEFDVPCPTSAIDPTVLLGLIDHAVHCAATPPAGPVHLNFMFREPFLPDAPGDCLAANADRLPAGWLGQDGPFTSYQTPDQALDPSTAGRLAERLGDSRRGLLLAGAMRGEGEIDAVRALAERLRWPLLADVASGLRLGSGPAGRVDAFDLFPPPDGDGDGPGPDMILHLGGRLTSKRLLAFLERQRAAVYLQVKADALRLDPTHQGGERLEIDVEAFCRAMLERLPAAGCASELLAPMLAAAEQAERVIAPTLEAEAKLTEPAVARLISTLLPEGHGLFLASSLPVREMDVFASAAGGRARVAANRGASGIDGTVAAAAGFAHAGGPATLLIGDLALLHDLNSLALTTSLSLPLVIVVLNNDGGGMFSFLPVATHSDVFERCFATPHGLQFAPAAEMFGLDYSQPTTSAEFTQAYAQALTAGRPALIEVRTDRGENHALQEKLRAAVAAALG